MNRFNRNFVALPALLFALFLTPALRSETPSAPSDGPGAIDKAKKIAEPDIMEKKDQLSNQVEDKTHAAKVNINSAPVELIAKLPGVGKKRAAAIVAGRPYATVDDLAKVKGIKPALLEKLKDKISVE